MMDNFLSTLTVLDIRRERAVGVVLVYWSMRLCVHHVGVFVPIWPVMRMPG